MRTANIYIHHENIRHNIRQLKSLANNSKLLAMVKANAYGHGVANVVPAMHGADAFGVACMSEALAVKNALPSDDVRPIVIMQGAFGFAEWEQAIAYNFACVVHCDEQVAFALTNLPKDTAHTHTLWLKYNTGMHRLGFLDDKIVSVGKQLLDKGYRIVLISHFACADDKNHPLNAVQIEKFNLVFQKLKDEYGDRVQGSLCNSAGVVNFKNQHHDWVRTGIAMYGSTPVADKTADELSLKPAMSLTAKIMAIQPLKKGEFLGYGATWQADKDSTIGIISLGYGDGYPRVVVGARVLINNQFYPIVGRVAMDMIAVDLSGGDVAVGDGVLFWGQSPSGLGIDIDEVAKKAGTIGYELMCRLTTRADRVVLP